ncbi:amidohydrolase [Thalassobius sp. Cn5-15]|uniref:amidohydrolase family protein n=1 Tax=Thalassobius sp. Cn5-15 TaxID=2917763 RepID=UPI001EF2E6BE|nr:amidohydrolase family protein [Thalassobius sp. Cn5-15]MCG7494439.1 amidohydrolase family protein [Thalassobius sp. Cn5-15]
MRIDAHQHFWALSRGDYGWLTPDLGAIYHDFLPDDLAPTLDKHAIDGTIVVQAAPTVAETEFMLTLAQQTPFIKGVVGWVDFESDMAVDVLTSLAQSRWLVGIRPMIQDIPDPDWMLQDHFAPIYKAMIQHDLVFDALTLPRHLGALRQLLDRHPEMRVVINHGAKPLIADGIIQGWREDMAALAARSNVSCKLSGLVTEAGEDWTPADLKPYVDHLLDCFGPQRLIWGSDWPVCTLAASYNDWVGITEEMLAHLSQQERDAIWGMNAQRVYKIEE